MADQFCRPAGEREGGAMSEHIRIGLVGYGNLGKGVEAALQQNDDMQLRALFTRRDPSQVQPGCEETPVYHFDSLWKMKEEIDLVILCGSSISDLPQLSPMIAREFSMVDSFDTHAKIPEHFARVNKEAKAGSNLALISAGWDPGLFSVNRLMAKAMLPSGKDYSFWGKGVSQGHSNALRRVEGVLDGRQYTIPVEASLAAVRAGEMPELSTSQKHTRLAYVVADKGADKGRIEKDICSMPDYFDEYETEVVFISEEEMKRDHSELPHGGMVLRSGKTGLNEEHAQLIEYRLQLASNPEFTGSVLVAYARACYRLVQEGKTGCCTALDVPPSYLLNMSDEDMRASLL